MSTLEDKILDGPKVNYCDDGDDDIRTGEDTGHDKDEPEEDSMTRNDAPSLFRRPDEETERLEAANSITHQPCCSTNTGPKGVLEDHRKRSLPTHVLPNDNDLEGEFMELLNDDSIIKSLAEKRLAKQENLPTFGSMFRLSTGPELLDAIDKENPNVKLIVHIYTKYSRSCAKVNKYLDTLAADYAHIKFVTLDASVAGLSDNFKENGVPALLIYKGGNFIKSVVQLEDLLDKDFEVTQLRELMIDNGLIP